MKSKSKSKSTKNRARKLPKIVGLRSEPQDMTFDDYDDKIEKPALRALARVGAKGLPTTDLGLLCYYDPNASQKVRGRRARNVAQAKSWARNAVRRPFREGHVERVAHGDRVAYRLTRKGRNQVVAS